MIISDDSAKGKAHKASSIQCYYLPSFGAALFKRKREFVNTDKSGKKNGGIGANCTQVYKEKSFAASEKLAKSVVLVRCCRDDEPREFVGAGLLANPMAAMPAPMPDPIFSALDDGDIGGGRGW